MSIVTWQDGRMHEFYSGENVISNWHRNISLSLKFEGLQFVMPQLVLSGVSVETSRGVEYAF